MFDSLEEQIKKDDEREVTRTERIIRWTAV
jgi:hypothetical protein